MFLRNKYATRFKPVVYIVAALSLGACASHGVDPVVVIKAPEDFTNSFSEMTYKLLPANEQVRLAINNEDPAFNFEDGSSFYEALSLPLLAQPYEIKVQSEVVTSSADYHGEIFFPVLTFLDENKQHILSVESLPYVLQEPATERNYMQASIQISDELASARYMVVHTQPEKLQMSIARGDGRSILRSSGYQTMMYAPSTKPRYRVNFSDSGWVRIKAFRPIEEPVKQPQKKPQSNGMENKYY